MLNKNRFQSVIFLPIVNPRVMLRARHGFQILNAIVSFLAVAVMNNPIWPHLASMQRWVFRLVFGKMSLHDEPMLSVITARFTTNQDFYIAATVQALATIPFVMIRAAALLKQCIRHGALRTKFHSGSLKVISDGRPSSITHSSYICCAVTKFVEFGHLFALFIRDSWAYSARLGQGLIISPMVSK